jgi:RNA polymerase sigma factor (sigma-70 family)
MQRPEADDVVQEMLFRIWQNKDKNGIANLKHYIFSCLRNISVDSRRGKVLKTVSITETNHLGLTLEQSLQSLGLTLVESLVSEEQVRRIQGIIAGLPQPLREALNLYISGVSESDAAKQLNLTLNAYKLKVLRAKNTLEQRLLAQGVRFKRVKHAKPNKKSALE